VRERVGVCERECVYVRVCRVIIEKQVCYFRYGVATISRLLKMIGLFCRRAL